MYRENEDYDGALEIGFFTCEKCGEVLESNGDEDIACHSCQLKHEFKY